MVVMTVLENDIGQEKRDLSSYYTSAQKAQEAKKLIQALEISEQGRIQAEIEEDYEWVQRFRTLNSTLQSKSSLNTTIVREDITIIKGVGPSVAEKLKEHGFDTIEKLASTTISQLSSVRGIGPATAQKILDGARSLNTRKSLNSFTQLNDDKILKQEQDDHHNQEDCCEISSESRSQKWFSDKFKSPKTNIWFSPSGNTRKKNYDDITNLRVEDNPKKLEQNNRGNNISTNVLKSTQLSFIEEEATNSIQSEIDLSLYEDKIELSEKKLIESRIQKLFQDNLFNLISPIPPLKELFTSADFIALKKIEFDSLMNILIIIPLKISPLKGELNISNQSIKYTPIHEKFKDHRTINKLILDSYFENIQNDFHYIYDDLIHKGSFHDYIKHHFRIDVSVKKTLTHKTLFFMEGNIQLKVFIEPILICHNNIGFLEKKIPFAYLNDLNIHLIRENKLSDLLNYLEQKYLLLETYNKKTHTLISYNDSYEQFLKHSTLLSLPFIALGVIYLLLLLFQSFEVLKFFINIGFALLGVFLITLSFLYLKVFKPKVDIIADFLIPHYKKKIDLDETSLILINEKLTPELMMQFGYECLGKSHNSKIMNQVEQEQMKEIVDKNRLLSQVRSERFFEKKTEKKSKKEDLIHRYSTFLED
jgi:predicted flap endonuclease-1-like 5' DNA nuclease